MNEPLSRPLSPQARAALIDFIEAYVASLRSAVADRLAERVKQKAVDLLTSTDIDILVFVAAVATLHSVQGVRFIAEFVVAGSISARDAAVAVVRIVEEAIRRDKQGRGGMG